MTEVEESDALEDIIDIEDNSVKQLEYEADVKMNEMDKEKQTGEDVRKRAMGKLGQSQKRKGDKAVVENERRSKKRWSNGSDTLPFLREKNVMESEDFIYFCVHLLRVFSCDLTRSIPLSEKKKSHL